MEDMETFSIYKVWQLVGDDWVMRGEFTDIRGTDDWCALNEFERAGAYIYKVRQ